MKRFEFETFNHPRDSLEKLSSESICVAVGTAFPKKSYTQKEVKQLFGIKNRIVHKLMDSGHIQKRHLYLPEADPDTGRLREETPQQLNSKFISGLKEIGVQAAQKALFHANLKIEDVDQLIAVTSSGFAVPGASSIIARELGAKSSLHRLDIVGMGCNAGMSALQSAHHSVKADDDRTTLIVCCEVNSAGYLIDETVRTGIVNSLFGDGASAIVLQGKNAYRRGVKLKEGRGQKMGFVPFKITDFESFTISEHAGAMRFDYNEDQNKWSFFLSKDIPFVVGENIQHPVLNLLNKHGLDKTQVSHWIMHTGGQAVIDGAQKSLGLADSTFRHTRSVLRDFGNLSSGSFLVSLERFYEEGKVRAGDIGLLIAMGPGATIEVALVHFFDQEELC